MRKILATTTLMALCAAPAAMAQMDHSNMDHSAMPMAEDMIHAEATLNAIGDGTLNVSHGPIKEIGWPAMTMDLPMMAGANLPDGLEPGDKVLMMLGQDHEGMYAISGLEPME
ncbi:copper-binding protein [Actibacterium ureilyticum]|uniref:copper-binding protein n=1 Tax=Actibacterium ureilyticum TaxID=1590614 RepID=UPI000BAACF37|nr:copper-binding protein [Actibacterium ureilyticum]